MHVSSDEAAPTTGKVREVVVAAVCFRPFHTFAEIAFLAVSSKDQVRGYGTRLMNHLKEAVKVRGVTDLVTYADNAAVGYFSKQGFYSPTSAQATKKDSKWHTCIKTGYDSYIKDYDGANKMVCCIYKNVNYLTLSTMREEVQAAFWRAYLKVTDHKVYEGLKTMPEKIYDIPGLEFLAPPSKQESTASPPKGIARKPKDESGSPSPPRQRPISSRLQVPTSIEAMVHDLLESALSNGSSWPFREPVDVSLAPDYYEVIKTPMDIATMKAKNAAGDYRSLGELRNDFRLMFDNCLFYNGEDSIYAQAADVLEKAVMARMDRLEQMAKAAR
jgi:histone acetyltransferase